MSVVDALMTSERLVQLFGNMKTLANCMNAHLGVQFEELSPASLVKLGEIR